MIHKLQHCTKLPTTAIVALPLLATAVNHQQMLRFSNTGSVLVFVSLEMILLAQPEQTIWAAHPSFDHSSVCSFACPFVSSCSHASIHSLVGLFVHSTVFSGWELKVVLLSDYPASHPCNYKAGCMQHSFVSHRHQHHEILSCTAGSYASFQVRSRLS